MVDVADVVQADLTHLGVLDLLDCDECLLPITLQSRNDTFQDGSVVKV